MRESGQKKKLQKAYTSLDCNLLLLGISTVTVAVAVVPQPFLPVLLTQISPHVDVADSSSDEPLRV